MKFKEIIEYLKTNYSGYNCFLACSGGVDSMVLLDLFRRSELNLTVIHVNYHLRGFESDEDESFIKNYCEENGIPFFHRHANWKGKSGNIQQNAREMRYSWFREILENPVNRVFLAHHLDDQVETFYLNLARNAGVMGLACMLPENNGIVRPLLDFSKEEIRNYAVHRKLNWREDSSNATLKYNRNLLRNKFLPEVRTVIPSINESVKILIQHLQKKQKELEEIVKPLIQKVISVQELQIKALLILDEFELSEFLRQLNQPVRILEEFRKFLSAGNGMKFIFSENDSFKEAYIHRANLHFVMHDSDFRLPELIYEEITALPTYFDKDSVYLDALKIKGELKLRIWQAGDRMKPIGMNGSKLISDIIHDENVPPQLKQNILVLHDNIEIHWCVGLKIGRNAVAGTNSKKIIKCYTR